MRAISTYLRRLRLAVTLLCVTPVIGFAQDYRPDILELSPGEGLSVPWDKALDLSGGGTVEFWVVPTFEGVPNYDPVILSSAGPNGAPYLIAMLRDKDGIAVVAGEEEGVIPYEFTDGKLHHVAVNSYADGIIVYIGGSAAASFDFTVPEIPRPASSSVLEMARQLRSLAPSPACAFGARQSWKNICSSSS